jgi:hypothetical protein
MGGKRTGAGQCLYLCFAGLILFALSGCAGGAFQAQGQCVRLEGLLPLIERGEFDRTVKESEGILAASPGGRRAADALFALGLVYAHADNPRKDYRKSREYFSQVRRQFPDGSAAQEARIWISVLDLFEKTRQIDIEIEDRKKAIH